MIRLISDVHGKTSEYLKLLQGVDFSIQLGDLGFDYEFLNVLDPNKHRVLGGNHDNYAEENGIFIKQTPHFLGDFGVHTVGEKSFFYVRGGRSIDLRYRVEGRDWWRGEEIKYKQAFECIEFYSKVKPDYVISHECPASIIKPVFGEKLWDGELIKPSMTANLLQLLFDVHQPTHWFFAHHHKNIDQTINGTRFICMEELGFTDLL